MRHSRLRIRLDSFRVSTGGALIFVLLLASGFSVAPQVHERIHADANKIAHECAVTLIASGNYHHATPVAAVIPPVRGAEFLFIAALSPSWVPSLFLNAHVFEHAPPQGS
jgi:hypothetical protein